MINTLHTVLVFAFVLVTAMLLTMTVARRLRIRGVRLVWRAGGWQIFPIWPTLFMGLVTVFLVYAHNAHPVINLPIYLGYLLGGALWFTAVALATSTIITEYGIISEAGRTGDSVGWGQITDWFEVDEGRRSQFVFFYQDFSGERRRLQVPVPLLYADRFRGLVRTKLEASLDIPAPHMASRKALEN